MKFVWFQESRCSKRQRAVQERSMAVLYETTVEFSGFSNPAGEICPTVHEMPCSTKMELFFC